jgi:hypothetical protein
MRYMILRARLVEDAFQALARSRLAGSGAATNAVSLALGDTVAVTVPHPDDETIGSHHLMAVTGHEIAYDGGHALNTLSIKRSRG